jgi:hypothetical protein
VERIVRKEERRQQTEKNSIPLSNYPTKVYLNKYSIEYRVLRKEKNENNS